MSYLDHIGVVILETILLLSVITVVFRLYWFITASVYDTVSKRGSLLASPLIAPGVVAHELSHIIFCLIFFRKITSIKLFTLDQSTGELGHVAYSHKEGRTFLTTLYDFIIGLAPIAGGALGIYLVSYLLLDKIIFNYIMGSLYDIALSSAPYQKEFWIGNVEVYWNVLVAEEITLSFIVWAALIVSLSHGLMPSTQDLKLSFPMMVIFLITGIAALFIAPEHTVPFGYQAINALELFLTILLTLSIPILITFVMTKLLMIFLAIYDFIKIRIYDGRFKRF